MKKISLLASALAATTGLLTITAWYVRAQGNAPPRQTSPILGQALSGLTADQAAAFQEGLQAFSKTETRADGLGVIFNGTTCAECHKSGAIGGAGIDLTIARVTRIGGMRSGVYSDLANLGGPVMQSRSFREFDTSCPVNGEVPPPQANFVSHRITLQLFGDGLIEAIPGQAILAQVGHSDPDGVQGAANIVFNPETGQNEVGRFGWKAQHSSLHLFAGDAYLNEMGVINPSFPNPNLPQGLPIPAGWGPLNQAADEDDDVTAFTNFSRYLAPPGRRLPVTPTIQSGEQVFAGMRCSACHVSTLKTGPNVVAALSNQPVPCYSDLLLHHMGPGLADGIEQGQAKGDQFRTAPLWGLSHRAFYLHDGRAQTLDAAIESHGGEASAARQRYMQLHPQDRAALLAFLNSL